MSKFLYGIAIGMWLMPVLMFALHQPYIFAHEDDLRRVCKELVP